MAPPILEVYQSGPVTVVGFGGHEILTDVNLALCREELLDLIIREQCHTVAFDLTGVRFLPSGLLGILASLRTVPVEVHLYNPCPDIVEVLDITQLNRLIPVHFLEVPRAD